MTTEIQPSSPLASAVAELEMREAAAREAVAAAERRADEASNALDAAEESARATREALDASELREAEALDAANDAFARANAAEARATEAIEAIAEAKRDAPADYTDEQTRSRQYAEAARAWKSVHQTMRDELAALIKKYSNPFGEAGAVDVREQTAPSHDDPLAFLDAPAVDAIELLTHSRRRTWNACHYKHHVKYELGIAPVKKSEALAFGTFCHDAIEAYWRARMAGDADAFAAILDTAEAKRANIDAFAFVKALALLGQYAMSWDGVACTALAVEAEFQAPLVDPSTGAPATGWLLGGKVDLIVRLDADAFGLPAGAVVLVEHKTTGATLDTFRESLTVAGQAGQYTIGARAIGFEIDHVLYDVLVKPGIRPMLATPLEEREYTKAKPERKCKPCKGAGSTQVDGVHVPCEACAGVGSFPGEPSRLYSKQRELDETAEEYGARCSAAIDAEPHEYIAQIESPRTADEMARFERDAWDAHQLIQLSKERRIIDRNESECIGRYGNKCEFFDHCTGVASLDDSTRFVRVGAHP